MPDSNLSGGPLSEGGQRREDLLGNCKKNSIEAVVQVLLLTVYADRVKRPPEISEVRNRLLNLAIFAEDEFKDHNSDLNALIDKYDTQVHDAIDQPDLIEITDAAINRIDDPMLIPLVVAAMRSVAFSDEEFHNTENILLTRAAELWGMVPLDFE